MSEVSHGKTLFEEKEETKEIKEKKQKQQETSGSEFNDIIDDELKNSETPDDEPQKIIKNKRGFNLKGRPLGKKNKFKKITQEEYNNLIEKSKTNKEINKNEEKPK